MNKRLTALLTAPAILAADGARAAEMNNLVQVPVIINLVILLGAIACLVIAIKLFRLVKGGSLARGWLLLAVSFVTLTFGQVLALAEKTGLLAPAFDLTGLLYLATVILWFVGLTQTRKVLG